MNSNTNQTARFEESYLQAIAAANVAARQQTSAFEKLLDATGALTAAHDAHTQAETLDDLRSTLATYNEAKDTLAGLAISYNRALEHAAFTKAALIAQMPKITTTRTLDADQQIGILQDYSAALHTPANTKTAEYAAYEIEDATFSTLDHRIATRLIELEETDDWSGDPADDDMIAFVRSLDNTPFEEDAETPFALGLSIR